MHKFLSLSSLILVVGSVAAQDSMGLFRNTDVTFTSRGGGSGNFVPSVQWSRIDVEKYAGWGYDGANPTARTFSGLHFFIQDQDLATPDTYTLVAYTEDPANPGFPAPLTPLATTGNFGLPTGTGAGAYNVTANFATPVAAPAAADVYVGISQNGSWTNPITDGLSIWAISAASGTTATRDLPGASAPTVGPLNTYSGYFVPSTTTLAYSSTRQFLIEPITASAAGVASALHYADTLHAASNTAPGTSCMFSSQFPDGASPSRNPGRADDLGMTFVKTGIPDNSLVFWLADFSMTFGIEIPLATFVPGSTGAVCVNIASFSTLGFSVTTGGVATNVVVFPAASRGLLLGLPIIQQAAALESAAGILHAGPCQLSIF